MARYPHIDGTQFGSIRIDGTTYDNDVWIFADGTIRSRDRSLSGSSHTVSKAEMEALCETTPQVVFVGSGQNGVAQVAPEARDYLQQTGVELRSAITPKAVDEYNRCELTKAGVFHLTC
ncbi:MAG: MTH938/NDUFAF3 family protein [Phycisphaerae bacterium]